LVGFIDLMDESVRGIVKLLVLFSEVSAKLYYIPTKIPTILKTTNGLKKTKMYKGGK